MGHLAGAMHGHDEDKLQILEYSPDRKANVFSSMIAMSTRWASCWISSDVTMQKHVGCPLCCDRRRWSMIAIE